MENLSVQLREVRQSPTVALSDHVKKLISQEKNIIQLQVGDPDFGTPEKIIRLAYEYMREGYTHYTNSQGLPVLREEIAKRYRTDYGVNYDPYEEILICNGGIHAVYCSLAAILNKDDEVLIVNPSWGQYYNIVSILGGKPVLIDTKYEDDFLPDIDTVKKSITDRTVAIILNYPNNPTGLTAKKEYLEEINQIAIDNNLWIISDEVYEKIIYDEMKYNSFCEVRGARDRVILVNSFSKTYAMTGWRIGFILANKQIIELALKISQHTITNVQTFVQKAVADCINDNETNEYVKSVLREYQKRRLLVKDIFQYYNPDKIKIKMPGGALYFFIDVRSLNKSSEVIAKELLDKKQVAYVPGSAFGSCGEGFLRMTIASKCSEIEIGFKRLLEWAIENS